MTNPTTPKLVQYIKDKFFPSPKLLVFEEIGRTITMPAKFRLLSQKEINRITKTSKKPSDDAELNDNSNCRRLFMAILGKRNLIQGSSSNDNSNTIADLERITLQEKNTLISLFEKKYATFSKVTIESNISNEKIDTLDFNRVEVFARTPTRVISKIYIYHALHNGRDIAIGISFNSEEAAKEIFSCLRSSKFK